MMQNGETFPFLKKILCPDLGERASDYPDNCVYIFFCQINPNTLFWRKTQRNYDLQSELPMKQTDDRKGDSRVGEPHESASCTTPEAKDKTLAGKTLLRIQNEKHAIMHSMASRKLRVGGKDALGNLVRNPALISAPFLKRPAQTRQ